MFNKSDVPISSQEQSLIWAHDEKQLNWFSNMKKTVKEC